MRCFQMAFASLVLALSASSAQAGLLTFDFLENGTGDLGTATKTFRSVQSASATITATGTDSLYVKTSGGDETGLGLTNGSDHEITLGNHIDFNFSNFKLQSLTFNLGSVTGNDAYEIYALNNNNTVAVDLGGGHANGPFSVPTADLGYSKFRVSETGDHGGNILVDSIVLNGSAVPEPSSFALMGIAGAIGLVVRRARKGRVA